MEARPNTVGPGEIPIQTVEITSAELQAMTDQELDAWAWSVLGVSLDPSWKRTRKLTFLSRFAHSADDI